jgi:hypothetical protein
MDMVLAGDDPGGSIRLTVTEAKTQLSIWSVMASPLFMSNNISVVAQEYREVLINKEMIKVHGLSASVPAPLAYDRLKTIQARFAYAYSVHLHALAAFVYTL